MAEMNVPWRDSWNGVYNIYLRNVFWKPCRKIRVARGTFGKLDLNCWRLNYIKKYLEMFSCLKLNN